MTTSLTREQVLAHRVRAQQLDRPRGTTSETLAVLALGVQDSRGQARLAMDARLPSVTAVPDDPTASGQLELVWSHRGAPHLHRGADLAGVRRAVWPLSDADAIQRLGDRGHGSGLDVWTDAVRTMRPLLPAAVPKGDASRALSDALPDALSYRCRVCRASHVSDSLFRPAAFLAGATLDWDTSPPLLRKRKGRWPGVPSCDIGPVIEAYLQLLGPATPGDVAGYLGARAADVRERWPNDLVEVDVDGRKAWLRQDDMSTIAKARMRKHVRLLGPYDPWLQARDRALIVPDRSRHKSLWPVLGRPGAVLVDGEVAGTWRTKVTSARLDLTVEMFAAASQDTRAALAKEAERMRVLRGVGEVRMTPG